jgi:hypothetical protein
MNAERPLAHYERIADAPDAILRRSEFVAVALISSANR